LVEDSQMRMDQPRPQTVDILIAEDDLLMRKSLRSLLEGQGYRCVEAENGIEAVALARRHPPRCVLLDLAMPGLDGLAVARELRADERTRAAHIHCLTGLADPAMRRAAGLVGCELFLTKPVDPDRILEAVQGQVRRSGPRLVRGLNKTEAEDLLDSVENHGGRSEVAYSDRWGFVVRSDYPPEADPEAGAEPEGSP
jgi:CheY-like chemotaxis protein